MLLSSYRTYSGLTSRDLSRSHKFLEVGKSTSSNLDAIKNAVMPKVLKSWTPIELVGRILSMIFTAICNVSYLGPMILLCILTNQLIRLALSSSLITGTWLCKRYLPTFFLGLFSSARSTYKMEFSYSCSR